MPLFSIKHFSILKALASSPSDIEQRYAQLTSHADKRALLAAHNNDKSRVKVLEMTYQGPTESGLPSFFFSQAEPSSEKPIPMIPSELGVYVVARGAMQALAYRPQGGSGGNRADAVHSLLVQASLASTVRLRYGCITKTCVDQALDLMKGDLWAACTATALSEREVWWQTDALRPHILELEAVMLQAKFIPLFNDATLFKKVAAGEVTEVAVPIGDAAAVIASLLATRPAESLVPGEVAMYDAAQVEGKFARVTYACICHGSPTKPPSAPGASPAAAAEAPSPDFVSSSAAVAIAAASTSARDGRDAGSLHLQCPGRISVRTGPTGLARISITHCSQVHPPNLRSTHYTVPPTVQLQVLSLASGGTIGAAPAPVNALLLCQEVLDKVRLQL
jgi:hypothetical protein